MFRFSFQDDTICDEEYMKEREEAVDHVSTFKEEVNTVELG